MQNNYSVGILLLSTQVLKERSVPEEISKINEMAKAFMEKQERCQTQSINKKNKRPKTGFVKNKSMVHLIYG